MHRNVGNADRIIRIILGTVIILIGAIFNSWWGLIVHGFTPPPYKMNYNRPYYQDLFESYGFQTYFEQWCYSLKAQHRPQEKFYERHAIIAKNPDYHSEYLKLLLCVHSESPDCFLNQLSNSWINLS